MHLKSKFLSFALIVLFLFPAICYSDNLNIRLLSAAQKGDSTSVKSLLDKGADINFQNTRGDTALMLSMIKGDQKTVSTLLTNGARIHTKRNDGWTASMVAALNGHTRIMEILLDKGANVDAKGNSGQTLLITAAYGGHFDTVKLLLSKGANIDAKTEGGHTAISAAEKRGFPEIVKIIKNAKKSNSKELSNLMPPFDILLKGNNEVRVKNPNDFAVTVALRSGNRGKNFNVAADCVASVFMPNGKYQIFFVYSNKSGALFQGDDFKLNNNGVEIQIVKVVGGNYGIKRVK